MKFDVKNLSKLTKKQKRMAFLAVLIILGVVIYVIFREKESIYVGTIEVTEVDVAPRVSSQILERAVDEGDKVSVGDVLYVLTCENVYVNRDKQVNDFRRANELLNTGNMAPERFDGFKQNHDLTMLDVDWCTVRSPLNATVLTKFHEAGDYVFVGDKLMAIGDLSDVWAYVYVDQPMLVQLSIGQAVTGVLPELKNHKIPGRIIHIKDQAEFTPKNVQTRKERTRLVYGIKIRFDNTENLLKPGMPIEVRFPKLVKK